MAAHLPEGDRPMARRTRVGFTLVELLVVITIIGMLMALLMPAVNSVRENARRVTCANNMDQIALAMQNYVTSKGAFPGYRGNRVPDNNNNQNDNIDVSWFVAIAPQMEQTVIYDRWDRFDARIPVPSGKISFPLVEFAICPSDPAEQITPTNNQPVSHLSYVVNAGAPDLTPARPIKADRAPDFSANGVFHDALHPLRGRVGFEMKDGASNTLMLSENNQARYWSDVDENRLAFVFQIVEPEPTGNLLNAKINTGRTTPDSAVPNNDLTMARPSSNHPGGVMVVFCDGRTIFLREDIHYRVYQQLMTPDGYNPTCSVPRTNPQNGQPVVNSNKDYVLTAGDYMNQ